MAGHSTVEMVVGAASYTHTCHFGRQNVSKPAGVSAAKQASGRAGAGSSRVATVIGLGLIGLSAQAATIPVSTSAASSSTECTLVDAIVAANTDSAVGACPAGSGADVITLLAGSVIRFTSPYTAVTALPAVSSAITIEGQGATVQRDPTAATEFRLLSVVSGGDLTLRKLTLRGGVVRGVDGGGIEVTAFDARLLIDHGTVTDNASFITGGGPPDEYGDFPPEFGGNGGGIANRGDLTIRNSTVSGNVSQRSGGGVFNDQIVSIVDSRVSGNTASGGPGGGIFNFGNSSILRTVVSGNTAGGGGGFFSVGGETTISDSTLSGNTARDSGGGFRMQGSNPFFDRLTLVNTTISGNRAPFSAGGNVSGTAVTLTHCTVSANIVDNKTGTPNNEKGDVGGISFVEVSESKISRSVIAGNIVTNPPPGAVREAIRVGGTLDIDGTSVFGFSNDAGVVGFVAENAPGVGGLDVIVPSGPIDSVLGPLASNGGPTQTHALPVGSPAIDAAPAAACAGQTDQRGLTRPRNAGCDLGAYEFGSNTADLVVTQVASASSVPIGSTLDYTITVTNKGPDTATRVQLFDNLAAELTAVAVTRVPAVADSCEIVPGGAICELGNLAINQQAVVTLTARGVTPDIHLSNTVFVVSDAVDVDPHPADNSSEILVSVQNEVLDDTPDAIAPVPRTEVAPGALVISAPIAITGINVPVTAAISNGVGKLQRNCSGSSANSIEVQNGDTICVQHTAASGFGTAVSSAIRVGTVTGTFISTTRDAVVVPNAFTFGSAANVERGSVQTSAAVAITGLEASATVTVSNGQVSINGGAFGAGGTIQPGQTVQVRHTASSAFAGTVTSTVTIGGVQGTFTSTTVTEIKRPVLSLDNTNLQFDRGLVLRFRDLTLNTSSQPQVVTLTNTGNAPLSISRISTSGDFRHTTTCGMTVAPGARCTISIVFRPTQVGSRTGQTRIVSNAASSPDLISLGGTGKGLVAGIRTSVVSLDLGTVKLGSNRSGTVTVTSSGAGPLEIRSVVTGGDYSSSHNCPRLLDAGKRCTVTTRFRPTAKGARQGTLTITTSAPGTPTIIPLSGNGS